MMDGEVIAGLLLFALGGILLIWWILGQPGEQWPKPQARDTLPPLFDPFGANDDPALKVPLEAVKAALLRRPVARPRIDANGRLHDASGKFVKK